MGYDAADRERVLRSERQRHHLSSRDSPGAVFRSDGRRRPPTTARSAPSSATKSATAFDDQGRKSDGDGKLHDWWAPADAAEFDKRAKLLADQFSAYSVLPGVHVNGELTLGENIGDLGGLSIAYQAWKISLDGKPSPVIDGLTGDERFFFSWAQAWRGKARDAYLQLQALQIRTRGMSSAPTARSSNIQAFYDAFNVKPGDKLYRDPGVRVHIW